LLEFHFHVYFFQTNDASVADAFRLKNELLNGVAAKKFVLVCDGVNSTILNGFTSEAEVPPVNMEPRGPHPIGSFEVWVPTESLGAVMSHMMMHRGELSILFHPLSRHCVEDHTGRAMWLGPTFNIDRTVLAFDDSECDPPQYPELGMGYSDLTNK
jgi:DOPA 4,5-dioxygenase